MNSTLKPKQSDDPHDVVAVARDVARVVRAFEERSNLLRHAARHQSGPQANTGPGVAAASGVAATPPAPSIPTVDTTFRPAAVNEVQNNVNAAGPRRSIGRRAVRAFAALLVAPCIGVAGIVLNAHGDVAKQIAKSVPKLLTSPLLQKPGLPAQPTAPAVEADAANTAPPQPASPPQAAPEAAAPEAAAPAAATPSPDSSQLLQSMAHDLAAVGQQVEQLKASIEELQAGPQHMSREIAQASEQHQTP